MGLSYKIVISKQRRKIRDTPWGEWDGIPGVRAGNWRKPWTWLRILKIKRQVKSLQRKINNNIDRDDAIMSYFEASGLSIADPYKTAVEYEDLKDKIKENTAKLIVEYDARNQEHN